MGERAKPSGISRGAPAGAVDVERHRRVCKVCAHAEREEIERDFVDWKSPIEIAAEYGLEDRKSVYRHAHAFGLFERRRRNVRVSLERIIEKAGHVDVTAGAIVQAVATYARINHRGELVERSEKLDLNVLFERMTRAELEEYARTGKLPAWFTETVGAAGDTELSTRDA